jgi:hypothetical protein
MLRICCFVWFLVVVVTISDSHEFVAWTQVVPPSFCDRRNCDNWRASMLGTHGSFLAGAMAGAMNTVYPA